VTSPWTTRLLIVAPGAILAALAFAVGYEWAGVTVALLTAAFVLAAPFARRRAA
jgi:hypothetical protein